LLSLQRSFALKPLDRFTCFQLGSSTLGCRRCLQGHLSLPGELALLFLSRSLALHRALGAGRRNDFTLSPLLDGRGVPGVQRPFELSQHGGFCFSGTALAILEI
jgi:hypothetical protein